MIYWINRYNIIICICPATSPEPIFSYCCMNFTSAIGTRNIQAEMRLWTRTTFWKRNIEKESKRKKKRKKKLRLTGTPMASGKLSLICACFFDVFKGHPLIQGHPPIPSENCVCYFVFASISLFFYFSSFCLDCFPPCSLFSCWRYIGEGYFSMSFQGQTASCLMDASLHRVSVEDPPSFIAPWTCEKLYHPT